MKVVINKCYGGFGLSIKAEDLFAKAKGYKLYRYKQTSYEHQHGKDEYIKIDTDEIFSLTFKKDLGDKISTIPNKEDTWFSSYNINREDPDLISIVETLGKDADGNFAELGIVEIPNGTDYQIDEYDGVESIHEVHQSWY